MISLILITLIKQYYCQLLRSEYINLNGYKYFKFDESNGKYIYCDVEETVEHFLMNCKGNDNECVNFNNEFEMDYKTL